MTLVRWLCLALTVVRPCQAMCLDRNVLVANGTYAHPFEPPRGRRAGKLHVCGCEFANQEVLTGRASLPAVRVGAAARLRRRGRQGRGGILARALDDAKRRQLLAGPWRARPHGDDKRRRQRLSFVSLHRRQLHMQLLGHMRQHGRRKIRRGLCTTRPFISMQWNAHALDIRTQS